jgi:hypothetical protein
MTRFRRGDEEAIVIVFTSNRGVSTACLGDSLVDRREIVMLL